MEKNETANRKIAKFTIALMYGVHINFIDR